MQTNFLKDSNYLLNDSSGILEYLPGFLDEDYFNSLKEEVTWHSKTIKIFGKVHKQPRLISFQGNTGIHYTYSGERNISSPWTPSVFEIKEILHKRLKLNFNSCLLNYYRDGQDSMSWHSDDEEELGTMPTIASLSFGASRVFKYKKNKVYSLKLEDRSLLIMRGAFQDNYKHAIMKCAHSKGRINLTFRNIQNIN